MTVIMDINELEVDNVLAEAKAGRFAPLANTLRKRGVHRKIAEWVEAGCRTERGRGRPARDPGIESQVVSTYHLYREMIPPEDLLEKVLILSLKTMYRINEREVRRIVDESRHESIAWAVKQYGITEEEATKRWKDNRERRWQEWRAGRKRQRQRELRKAAKA